MKTMKEIFEQYTRKQQDYLIFVMEIHDTLGIPNPQNPKDFEVWCEEQIKKMK
jgi:hypothetical protein